MGHARDPDAGHRRGHRRGRAGRVARRRRAIRARGPDARRRDDRQGDRRDPVAGRRASCWRSAARSARCSPWAASSSASKSTARATSERPLRRCSRRAVATAAAPAAAPAPAATAEAPSPTAQPVAPARPAAPGDAAPAAAGRLPRAPGDKPVASPAVRRRAWDLGHRPAVRRRAAARPVASCTSDLDACAAGGGGPVAPPAPPSRYAPRDGEEVVPVIGLRRKIAQRMQESKRRIPHFTYVEEVDVTELEALRARLNDEHGATRGRLTVLPFLMRAIVLAVPSFPQTQRALRRRGGHRDPLCGRARRHRHADRAAA